MTMALHRDAEGRSTPAKVYPTFEDAGAWVVEPPRSLSDLSLSRNYLKGTSI